MRYVSTTWWIAILSAVLMTCGVPPARAGAHTEPRGTRAGSRRGAPRRAESRAAFGFDFATGNGERIDSFSGLVTKDLVDDPDTTIALAFTPAELDSVRREVLASRLFDLPDLRAPAGCMLEPNTWLQLRVRDGARERLFHWEASWACSDSLRASETRRRVNDIVWRLRGIVEAGPECQEPPRARGFYM